MDTRRRHYLQGAVLAGLLLGWSSAQAAPMPTPPELVEKYGLQVGLTVTKDNAKLLENLIPDASYRRLQAGDHVFTIGMFDPPDLLAKIWDKQYVDGSKANVGKYDVDADGGIIDKTTGTRPWPMPPGLPFPDLDLSESPAKVGTKMIWNVVSMPATCGEQDHIGARLFSGPRHGGYDRYFSPMALRQYIDFRRNPVEITRPVIFQEIFFFLEPNDAFGSANLTWRWSDPKKWDSVWSYSPSTRRIRRVTAANRSDATLGTEFVQDDGTPSYNGKVEMMNWKYIGMRDALIPVARPYGQAKDDYTARITYESSHDAQSKYGSAPGAFQQQYKDMTWGFMENPQQHASWWITNLLWVPVPVYIVEAEPKDPYYNFGRQVYFFERNSFVPLWKLSYNRSGEYWRTGGLIFEFVRFKDPVKGEIVCFDGTSTSIVDEQTNRGTTGIDTGGNLTGQPLGGPTVYYNTGLGADAFDLARFLQYGK